MFWIFAIVFFIGNMLLAWSATFKNLDEWERPRIARASWFQMAAIVGGIGWLAVPAMFYWRYGFLGAGGAFAMYLLSGALVAAGLKAAIERS